MLTLPTRRARKGRRLRLIRKQLRSRLQDIVDLIAEYDTAWRIAQRLVYGGRHLGDDLHEYRAYQDQLNEHPYLFGRPCPAFDYD